MQSGLSVTRQKCHTQTQQQAYPGAYPPAALLWQFEKKQNVYKIILWAG